jgi:hypothetical protein
MARIHYRSTVGRREVVACEEGTRLHERLAGNRLWERVDGKTDTILDEPEPPTPPKKSDSKAVWVAHAVACGADEDAAKKATKQNIIDLYG